MKKNIEKNYNPHHMEERLYQKWLDKEYFKAHIREDRKPFTIVMPPPNITGKLHMGHALDNTLQDILIRFKRMQGYDALWLPGTDHASISTEVRVIDKLKAEGIDKREIGREAFLEHVWAWKEEYGNAITDQLKKLGASCDWSRERFTMDEGCSKAVAEVFVRLYEKGYIYKGNKIINWCPQCQTTISDAEVNHEEQQGFFWHMRYPFVDGSGYLEIATTRPETMLGDTAVAVHPEDERYQAMIGKLLQLPLSDRQIPVIADEYVDKEFGTGVVKITPAHDPNDFEVGLRHHLEQITVMNDDGTMNELAGKYQGLSIKEARKAVVKDLEDGGFLVKVEPHTHNVGTHERCNHVIEPMIKKQWFVKMEEMAKPAIEVLYNKKLQFIPENYGKTYLHWMENIKDWCISRQLWWGHQIPAYYCDDCGEMVVSKEKVASCPKCHSHKLRQDEDTLDTWFSSALWPFSTLGWPKETEDLKHFFPTNVLVTGYDIIFFWVARMVFSSLEQMKEVPFKYVLMHGLVRDQYGRKMSKSLGNGIDPLEIINQYGVDALRLMLMTGNAPGNDMRFTEDKLLASRNFANKVWNASRFIMMNLEKPVNLDHKPKLTLSDQWILSELNQTILEVTDNMEKFELGIAAAKIQDFIHETFCDWYIEMVKPRLYNDEDQSKEAALWTLCKVLGDSLKLLHPYMPFITEEIYCALFENEESIMISQWPSYEKNGLYKKATESINRMRTLVKEIRNTRVNMKVAPSKKINGILVSKNEGVLEDFKAVETILKGLGGITQLSSRLDEEGISKESITIVAADFTFYIPFEDLVDVEAEIQRLTKEKERLEKELVRVRGMLSNPGFVSKAPKHKIEEEENKKQGFEQMLVEVEAHLVKLSQM